jgi:hypothetical protein
MAAQDLDLAGVSCCTYLLCVIRPPLAMAKSARGY